MNPLDLIYALFIGPLELFFEVLYAVAFRLIGDPGLAIVALSLAMNFLVLPLYRRADAMQEAERERAKRMKRGNDHIRKTFKGDERFMMQQTFNRQNGYAPTDALKGSVSLLLEIPFFIAAYHFLSTLSLLRGVPFGPIADLGAPDALLQVGGVAINVLPLLMTAINLASAIVYMKGLPLANKVQMYGIAAIFLVLLYNSPSGLVFYWTLNNIFSLVKNLFYRMRDPRRVLVALASVAGLALLVVCVVHPMESPARQLAVAAAGLALQLPLAWRLVRKRGARLPLVPEATPATTRAFVLSALFLALLTGALIPTTVIAASPGEFVSLQEYCSPLWYVARTLAIAVGTFVIWFGVFYWLAAPRGKTVFACGMFAACGVTMLDYLLFGVDLGNLSTRLQFENQPVMQIGSVLMNLAAIVAVAALLALAWKATKGRAAAVACACLCVAATAMSAVQVGDIASGLQAPRAAVQAYKESGPPQAQLSRDGRNVVVIMLDRAISYYVPYIMAENPRIAEGLQGFTFYPNAVSYGLYTNVGTPGLYGGYDYTPKAMNARSDQLLADKHDEALKVMPRLFSEHGFASTFFDPTYAGYGVMPDLRVFDDLPGVNAYITMSGEYVPRELGRIPEPDSASVTAPAGLSAITMRNFFCYSLFTVAPTALQPLLYHGGDYNTTAFLVADPDRVTSAWYSMQTNEGPSMSRGVDQAFSESYGVLQSLPEIARVVDGDQDTLLVMSNDTAHSPCVLDEPSYAPALRVDNTAFDATHRQRVAADGSALAFPEESGDKDESPLMHYQVNTAALRALCDWFDYLRANDAFDNTRIILVSDHGRNLGYDPELTAEVPLGPGESLSFDLLAANCLLMVKDFDSHEFRVDERFMTNADTPTLAAQGLIENPVNPYTGTPLDSAQKLAGPQELLFSYNWNTKTNNGATFLPGYWFSVHDDIRERGNWEYVGSY